MKAKWILLLSVLLVTVLGNSIFADVSKVSSNDDVGVALANLETVKIVLAFQSMEPNETLDCKWLINAAANRLQKAGLKIEQTNQKSKAEFRVSIETVKLTELDKYTFRIQTSLARFVTITDMPKLELNATVWKTKSVMQTISAEQKEQAIKKIVLAQTNAFIASYLKVRKKAVNRNKSSNTRQSYISSKNSPVFHKPDCTSTKRIKPENRVKYNSRNDAILAGKRPCKKCNP